MKYLLPSWQFYSVRKPVTNEPFVLIVYRLQEGQDLSFWQLGKAHCFGLKYLIMALTCGPQKPYMRLTPQIVHMTTLLIFLKFSGRRKRAKEITGGGRGGRVQWLKFSQHITSFPWHGFYKWTLSVLLQKGREEKNILKKNGPSMYHDGMLHLK